MRMSKIALEEHFELPGSIDPRPEMRKRLVDLHGVMLAEMDEANVEIAVLSLHAPGIQAIPNRVQAVEAAKRANDYVAEQVSRNPARLKAFAALPLQDPDSASRELIRCVKELGFKGALVNSFSQIDAEQPAYYYDLPQFRDFWSTVEALECHSIYIPEDRYLARHRCWMGTHGF